MNSSSIFRASDRPRAPQIRIAQPLLGGWPSYLTGIACYRVSRLQPWPPGKRLGGRRRDDPGLAGRRELLRLPLVASPRTDLLQGSPGGEGWVGAAGRQTFPAGLPSFRFRGPARLPGRPAAPGLVAPAPSLAPPGRGPGRKVAGPSGAVSAGRGASLRAPAASPPPLTLELGADGRGRRLRRSGGGLGSGTDLSRRRRRIGLPFPRRRPRLARGTMFEPVGLLLLHQRPGSLSTTTAAMDRHAQGTHYRSGGSAGERTSRWAAADRRIEPRLPARTGAQRSSAGRVVSQATGFRFRNQRHLRIPAAAAVA